MDYNCAICNKNYKTLRGITNHNNKYHINMITQYKCDYCDLLFKKKQSKTKHCFFCFL